MLGMNGDAFCEDGGNDTRSLAKSAENLSSNRFTDSTRQPNLKHAPREFHGSFRVTVPANHRRTLNALL